MVILYNKDVNIKKKQRLINQMVDKRLFRNIEWLHIKYRRI